MKYLLLLLLVGCTTRREIDVDAEPAIVVESECGSPRIELRDGQKWNIKEDVPNLFAATEGCVRYYGEGACLIIFYKKGRLNYHATCRRKT